MLFQLSFLLPLALALTLPPPSGPYTVGTVQFPLTDTTRLDPFAPATTPRTVMVQLFYPTPITSTRLPIAPYLGPATSAYLSSLGLNQTLQTHSRVSAPLLACGGGSQKNTLPTILFSPGLGFSRTQYTTLTEDLASHGYLVVSIDHPYDADIVEFPDGSLIFAMPQFANETAVDELLPELLEVRVADVRFVLDRIQANSTSLIPGAAGRRLKVGTVGMFGHSFGGATAANVMAVDTRVVGGLNMDGIVYGTTTGVGKRPFVLMGIEDHNLTSDATWSALWGNLTGWKKAVVVKGAGHRSFSDYGVLAELLGGAELGTIEPVRGVQVARAWVKAFFDYLGGKGEGLYKGPQKKWPEVVFQTLK